MNRSSRIFLSLIGVLGLGFFGLVLWAYLVNRTIDQTLSTNFTVSTQWLELTPNQPLTESRNVAELAIAIPDYRLNRDERLPAGQIRLPDGRIATPEIEAIDQFGNTVGFHGGSHTLSKRDLITYKTYENLEGRSLAKIRIRSDQPFTCEEIFWRNRNPK